MIAEETDFPPGVINIVTSSDHAVGAQLSSDPRVDIVSFTGSTATGRKVMAASAESPKKVFLNSAASRRSSSSTTPTGSACAMAAFAVVTHAGQAAPSPPACSCLVRNSPTPSRPPATRWPGLPPTPLTNPGTICGPLISATQRDRVEGVHRWPSRKAARSRWVVASGRQGQGLLRAADADLRPGQSARVAQEIFGPVLVIIAHDGDDDAIRIANDSPYGLSGMVYGTDETRINKVVDGAHRHDGHQRRHLVLRRRPFGGYKASGIGREMGVNGFEEYLEVKAVAKPA